MAAGATIREGMGLEQLYVSGDKKTILIADSSESFLIYLRILLERVGFRIIPLKKGYFESTVMVEYRQHGFCEVLPKPVTLTDLAEKLRSVLEGKTRWPGTEQR